MYFTNALIIKDFQIFIDHLATRKVSLTASKNVLKSSDLLVLNEKMLSFQTKFVTNKTKQEQMSLLNTFFYIAKSANLFIPAASKKEFVFQPNEVKITEYEELSDDAKYFFLLEAFWSFMDWDEAFDCRAFWKSDALEKLLKKNIPNKAITISCHELKRKGEVMGGVYKFFEEIMSAFGCVGLFWDKNVVDVPKNKYVYPYGAMSLTIEGALILPILFKDRSQFDWNLESRLIDAYFELEEGEEPMGRFEDAFKIAFPDLKAEHSLLEVRFPLRKGLYRFKVSFEKEVYRIIEIAGSDTFEELHLAIQDAMDFDNDHLYYFSLTGKNATYNSFAFWSPNGEDGVRTTMVQIGETNLYKGQQILYYFDFGASWRFDVVLLDIEENTKEPKEYKITQKIGENPKQYDWDDDDDE